MTPGFTRALWRWLRLEEILTEPTLTDPGVYVLAFSARRLGGQPVQPRDIFYVGMPNATGGVRDRLKQFRRGTEVNDLHSGAMRFYRDHSGGRAYAQLGGRKRLYAAALRIPCVTAKDKRSSADLRAMGHVACLEKYVAARVFEATGREPQLNKA